jgi:hypothetical protein
MRHLGSFLLALVLAPVVYLLTGVGLNAFGQAVVRGPQQRPMATVLALAALAVSGGIYAVLVMARLSPVGPALAGFFFLGVPAWPLVNRVSYDIALNEVNARFKIPGIDLVGTTGLGILLAVPLLATLASPRRWSRYDVRPAQVVYQPPPYAPPAYQAPYADETRQTAAQDPVTEQLPDVAAPTLHYPTSASAVAPPTAEAPTSASAVAPPTAEAPPAAEAPTVRIDSDSQERL